MPPFKVKAPLGELNYKSKAEVDFTLPALTSFLFPETANFPPFLTMYFLPVALFVILNGPETSTFTDGLFSAIRMFTSLAQNPESGANRISADKSKRGSFFIKKVRWGFYVPNENKPSAWRRAPLACA